MDMDLKETLQERVPIWESALENNGYVGAGDTRLTILEAFSSPDAHQLFPKVISTTLREAAEPELLISPLLQTVRLTQGRSIEFPAVNAIQAAEIPEGQEYPEQQLAFAKQVEGKVSKKGVKVSFTEEVINDSLWDIVGLHVRAAGRAMARLKEQIALQRFRAAATVRFDNDDVGVDDTTGLDNEGTANGALTWDDVVELAAVLVAENHVPTDFILHPLMWSIFLRAPEYHIGGPAAMAGWTTSVNSEEQVTNSTAPLGLRTLVSPFVSFTAKNGATPAKSDVFLVDRNEIGVMLIKEDMSTDEFTDPTRDIRSLKMKERYDIVTLGDGEGIVVAKNVNLVRHYEKFPVHNTGA